MRLKQRKRKYDMSAKPNKNQESRNPADSTSAKKKTQEIRLDDLIAKHDVSGGRRVVFGIRGGSARGGIRKGPMK